MSNGQLLDEAAPQSAANSRSVVVEDQHPVGNAD